MVRSEVLSRHDETRVVGYVFGAPLITRGCSWIPLAQAATWLIMSREAGRLHPERSIGKRLEAGGLAMFAILGSEWCHNLAHAAAARLVGKPVDAIRINLGMPLLVYYDIEDPTVTPQQHICRASGGPLINLFLLAVSACFRRFTRPGTMAQDTADAVRGINLFLVIAGLLPQPWLDGGVILKWGLVAKGYTLEGADEKVRRANGVVAAGLGIAAAAAFKGNAASRPNSRRWGWLFGLLAALSLATATGLLKEKA